MGRHDDDDDRKITNHESKEERLLRKAKEYVEREERKKDRHNKEEQFERDCTRDNKSRKYRSHDNRSDRKRNHKDDRKRSRKEIDSDNDQRKQRKKHEKKDREREAKKGHSTVKKLKIDKNKLYPLGDFLGTTPLTLLDSDSDYFAYHQHLWVYLYRDEGIIFGDLTSEEARAAFQRFCEKYNGGTLEQGYYKKGTLPQEAIDECKITRHKWAFQTSETERKSLQLVEDGVRKQTEYDAGNKGEVIAPMARPPTHQEEDYKSENNKTTEQRLDERRANLRLRDHVRTVEEELKGGSKDGRERQREKKQERASTIHASARDKESQVGGTELDDSILYGGDGSDFQHALAREKERKAQRHNKAADRIKELQRKEDDRQKAMLLSLGLSNIQPGQKIRIQPR